MFYKIVKVYRNSISKVFTFFKFVIRDGCIESEKYTIGNTMVVASVYWQLMINVDFCVKENIRNLSLPTPYNLNVRKCKKNKISRYNSYSHFEKFIIKP